MSTRRLSKADLEALAGFRYRLRRFIGFTKKVLCRKGVTSLQYRLLLQIMGSPDRDWSTASELAARLQTKPQRVAVLISRCDAAGLVRINAGQGDGPCVEVRLSPTGQLCLEHLARSSRDELRVGGSLLRAGSGDSTSDGRLTVVRTS